MSSYQLLDGAPKFLGALSFLALPLQSAESAPYEIVRCEIKRKRSPQSAHKLYTPIGLFVAANLCG